MPVRVSVRSSAWEGRARAIKQLLVELGHHERVYGPKERSGFVLAGTGDAVVVYWDDSEYFLNEEKARRQLAFCERIRPALEKRFRGHVVPRRYGTNIGIEVGPA